MKFFKRNKKQENEKVDFTKLSGVIKFVRKLFGASTKDEAQKSLVSMDSKLAERLADIGEKELGESIVKAGRKADKLGKSPKSNFLGIPAWANWAAVSFVLIMLISSSATYYFWNTGQNPATDLAEVKPIPTITLLPQNLTDSGYISPDNDFIMNIDGEITSDVEKVIKIQPEVAFTTEVEVKDGKSTIKINLDEQLLKGEKYSVTLLEGSEFSDGSTSRKELTWILTVEPDFALLGTTPADASTSPIDTSIEFEFNHKNIDETQFAKYVKFTPDLPGRFEKVGLKIVFLPEKKLIPNQRYRVFVSKDFANQDGQALGKDYEFTFSTSSIDSTGKYYDKPYLSWNTGGQLLNVNNNIYAAFGLSGSDKPVNFKLYSVTVENALSHISGSNYIDSLPKDAALVNEQNISAEVGVYTHSVGKGIYILAAYNQDAGVTIYSYFVRTNLGIVSNSIDTGDEIGWIFDMTNANPVNSAEIKSYKSDAEVGTATTDNKGNYKVKNGDLTLATKGEDILLFSEALRGSDMYDYYGFDFPGISGNYRDESLHAYTYTDRPAYAPGESVNFNALVRARGDKTLEIPRGTELRVVVQGYTYANTDAYGGKKLPIYEKTLKVDGDGYITGSFTIPASTDRGSATVTLISGDKYVGSTSFQIIEYQKPKYQYSVTYNATRYFNGESAEVLIQGKDYSGQPLSGQSIKVTLYRGTMDAVSYQSGVYGGVNLPYGNEKADEVTVKLNSQGQYVYKFTPVAVSDKSNFWSYTVQVSPSTEEISSSNSKYQTVLVASSKTDVSIKPSVRQVGTNDSVDLNISSTKLWSNDPDPKREMRIDIYRNWSESIENGTYYDEYTKTTRIRYRYIQHVDLYQSQTLQTNEKGEYTHKLQNLPHGYYRVDVDFGGTKKQFQSLVSVYKTDLTSLSSDIILQTEKYQYTTGDKVRGSVVTAEQLKGLFLVSGWGVENAELINTENVSHKYSFEFNATDRMFPSAYVCAYMIKVRNGEELSSSWVRSCSSISVASKSSVINIDIKPESELYGPGDKVKLNITTTDDLGAPVSSRVSIDVVDRALLDSVNFREAEPNSVSTQFYNSLMSFGVFNVGNPVFGPDGGFGAGGGGDGSLRQKFDNTAFWKSNILTDDKGQASVEFTLPDSLTSWNIRGVASTKTQFGIGYSGILSQLQTSVQFDAPKFLRHGDSQVQLVTVANFGEKFTGTLTLKCEGCKDETGKAEFSIEKSEVKTFEFKLEPADAAKELAVTFALTDSEGKVRDAIKQSIPIYSDRILQNRTDSAILSQNATEANIEVNMGGEVRADVSSIDLYVSKSFAIDAFAAPVSPSIRSTSELSNVILQNLFILEHYDEIDPEMSEEQIRASIAAYIDILRSNQNQNGGFGWFDYDAVSVESSMLAAEVISKAVAAGIEVPPGMMSAVSGYFEKIIISPDYALSDKVVALLGLANSSPKSAYTYLPAVRDGVLASETFKDSPLTLALLIQSYNTVGSTGDSASLAQILIDLVKENSRGALWEDKDTNYTLLSSSDYVTAMGYLALSPLEEWSIKSKVRAWLLDRDLATYYSDQKYMRIMYALAVADSESIVDRNKTSEIEVQVNGKSVDKFEISKDEHSRLKLNISSEQLKKGENKIRIIRKGSGELYILSVARILGEAPSGDKFGITRKFIDLNSGSEVAADQLKQWQLVKVHIEVTPSENINGVLVRDLLPSGLEPLQFGFSGISFDARQKFWSSLANQKDLTVGGSVAKDSVAFSLFKAEKDKTYKFEYLVLVKSKGEFAPGGTHVMTELFPDINSYLAGPVKVKVQ